MKKKFFKLINKYFLFDKNLNYYFAIVASLIIISTVLSENTVVLQTIQAQNNNDLSSTIQQGVKNQIENTLSNTPLASNNPQQQTSDGTNSNNIVTQSSNSIANNNNPLSSSSSFMQQQSGNNNEENNNINNNPSTQSNIPTTIGNNFIISGPLSSFISTPSGNWVVNGSWALKVQNGNLSFFRGFMQWDPTNITKLSHTHSFVNFRADPNTPTISLGPERIIDVKGIMDIGANNKIEWTNVPAEIKTSGNTITISILDDSKTGNHFNNYPVFGKISNIEKCSDNGGFGANMEYDPTMVKCSL